MNEEQLEVKKLNYKLEGYRQELAQKSDQIMDLRVNLTILDEDNSILRGRIAELEAQTPKDTDVQEEDPINHG